MHVVVILWYINMRIILDPTLCERHRALHRNFVEHTHTPPSNLHLSKMITGSVLEMLARNRSVTTASTELHHAIFLTSCSKYAATYQAPPGLMQMANTMRNSGAGVVVVSCSDPRLNPYHILGIDANLREY